jgi:N6-L-threonylcarbamoyladenine synthase
VLVLGIESSCDETAAALVEGGRTVRASIVASQIDVHRRFGGVVPEIASRKHMEAILPVVQEALDTGAAVLGEVEGIAVTRGPGLVGSLLVGLSFAKALALARGLPFVAVNHVEGHIQAAFLESRVPSYPFVALVVSGGHTHLYYGSEAGEYTLIGQTRDDAAGEALDKAAKLLDLGYPGGVVIDRLARQGDPGWIAFPRAMRDSMDFSFSGLKTSLLALRKRRGCAFAPEDLPHVAASYQEAIVDVLVEKTLRAAQGRGTGNVVVCGGVAANSRLRERMRAAAAERGVDVFIPAPVLCTDNAAMIAALGERLLALGRRDDFDVNAVSRWRPDQVMQ